MSYTMSPQELLAGLPLATAAITNDGRIVLANDLFWREMRCPQPVTCLAELKDTLLAHSLQELARGAYPTSGQSTYGSANGPVKLAWRRVYAENHTTVVITLLPESIMPAMPQPISNGVAGTGRDLPDANTTVDLMEQALWVCYKGSHPLSIARISVRGAGNLQLMKTDYGTWRLIGRKVRSACRMSDLVGITENGDFLIILMNLKLPEAQAVTSRVLATVRQLTQLNNAHLVWQVGHATWLPGTGRATATQLIQRAGENLQVTMPR